MACKASKPLKPGRAHVCMADGPRTCAMRQSILLPCKLTCCSHGRRRRLLAPVALPGYWHEVNGTAFPHLGVRCAAQLNPNRITIFRGDLTAIGELHCAVIVFRVAHVLHLHQITMPVRSLFKRANDQPGFPPLTMPRKRTRLLFGRKSAFSGVSIGTWQGRHALVCVVRAHQA